jgi:hypothetical protein
LKPGLAILALALIVASGAITWRGRVEWRRARAQRANLHAPVKSAPIPPVAAAPAPETPQAVKYADIANKNLFSKDRNPNAIVEPPKPAEVKKMPPLPVVYGVLGLPSGTKAIMAVKAGDPSRPVRAGDTVGEFKILALDTRGITFDWDGKQISKPVDQLIDRSTPTQSAPNPPPPSPAPPPAGGLAPVNPPSQQSAVNTASNPKLGKELGAPGSSVRGCVAGDSAPAGTIADGYRKQVVAGPFGIGSQCSWVPVK